jgi:acyl-CoA synthetase (NDP forming)
MVVDQLGIRGVAVEAPGEATRQRLTEAGIDPGHGRILDLTLAGTRPEVMRPALDALLQAPEFDLVIAVAGSSARFQPELAVQPVVEAAAGDAHLAAFCVPEAPQALAMLTAAGVPAFRTPEACADVVAAAFARREPRGAAFSPAPASGGERMLDEAEAYELLADLGVPHAPCVALSAARAGQERLPFPYPVAVKVLHRDILHKTDLGGVALGVDSDAALREAATRIIASVAKHRPALGADRVLVQAMTRPLGEVLVGYRRDPQVGPIILLAAGGVMTEIYRDRSVRLAPVSDNTAREMIAEVRALRALEGYRGKPRGDMEALAAAIVAVSCLAERGDVAECEINPLMVMDEGRGVIAVDAIIRLAGDTA